MGAEVKSHLTGQVDTKIESEYTSVEVDGHPMPIVARGKVPTWVPDGRALVHNHAPHTARTGAGMHGFRAWLEMPSDRIEPCDCGWSGLPHYKVKGMGPSAHRIIEEGQN